MALMSSGTLIRVEEYLSTSYRPDREYVDGVVLERNLGERDHSALQGFLTAFLMNHRKELGIHVFPEQRVQVTPHRFRVPDVCVVAGPQPQEQVFTRPPFLCIEILSKDGRMSEMQERINDSLAFGVQHVWVVDPRTRRAYMHTADGSREVKDGFLRTTSPDIAVPISELFAEL